ncbi:hypothetical protein VTK73DRAFT_6786 [Phialemonium thermophilum]|uniref:Kinetochore protein mis14 n=1 Tax=Phialemonium thermophilum TaxID=223376 RepID=A0ABR3Y754_9PEZI
MESSAAHRKIELQSAEDFTYLINNVRRAAADSINAAFPPVDGSDGQGDELRMQIEQLVNEYIIRTFTFAAPNITINGLSVDPEPFLFGTAAADGASVSAAPEEQYEPFDGRKRQRVEELAREEEDLLREIAALKHRVPAASAAAYAGQVRAAVAADEEALERARALSSAIGAEGGGKSILKLEPLERQAAVENSFRSAVSTLEKLKKEVPATVARMERARVAGEYVVTER